MSRVDIQDFDVIRYLESRNIPHFDYGDNVSRGWTSINCIFCIDHKNHLGINLRSKAFNCYKCGTTGSIFDFIKEVEGCSFHESLNVIREFNGGTYIAKPKQYETKIKYPMLLKEFPKSYKDFLISRRYDPDYVIKKYDLKASSIIGWFNHRIIIPVKMNNRTLSYVGRDITGKAHIPYKNSPEDKCIKDPKYCLYNIDSVIQNKVVLVEGILDAWRIGDGAVATFGIQYTHEQLLYLKGIKTVFVLYDTDAKSKAEKLAYDISAITNEVKLILLDEGDPDNLTENDVRTLRKEIGI